VEYPHIFVERCCLKKAWQNRPHPVCFEIIV